MRSRVQIVKDDTSEGSDKDLISNISDYVAMIDDCPAPGPCLARRRTLRS